MLLDKRIGHISIQPGCYHVLHRSVFNPLCSILMVQAGHIILSGLTRQIQDMNIFHFLETWGIPTNFYVLTGHQITISQLTSHHISLTTHYQYWNCQILAPVKEMFSLSNHLEEFNGPRLRDYRHLRQLEHLLDTTRHIKQFGPNLQTIIYQIPAFHMEN